MKTPVFLVCCAASLYLCAVPRAREMTAASPAPKVTGGGSALLQCEFNEPSAWPEASASVGMGSRGLQARAEHADVGTIDIAGSSTPSGGLRLAVTGSDTHATGRAILSSGLQAVRNTETNLAKLTLSFSLSSSTTRPVLVRMESFNAGKKRTGGCEGLITPAAPDFYQRYALELATLRPFVGAFQPTAPFVKISFEIQIGPESGSNRAELRLDNVYYAKPAYYVRPTGSDKNDGRSEQAPFATPQKAIDVAGPGNIVLVMNGTYMPHDVQEGVVAFRHAGTPSAWIVLKNYSGHQPVFSAVGTWNAIRLGQRGTTAKPSAEPALAYIETRGLRIRGDADVAKEKYADLIGKPDPHTNSNGINITGRYETNKPHHIRIADNVVEYCAGAGIGSGEADWFTIENNIVRNNCWWMIYAGSGISMLDNSNFDSAENVYKMLISNNQVSGNRCFVPWGKIKKISDGNGIIIDTNYVPAKNQIYLGRTLAQNNLSFNNGGSGIHSFRSHQIDIINNTAYMNGASPELAWGQIFVQSTDDVRMMNNILVARDGQPVNTVSSDISDKGNTRITRMNNLYFGGGTPPIMGPNDKIADPLFVNPSLDPASADFHVKADSPAVAAGKREPLVPWIDLEGHARSAIPTIGALEKHSVKVARDTRLPTLPQR